MAATQIFTNQTVDGNSNEFSINGVGMIKASGSFGGGLINLQAKLANTNDDFSNTGDFFTSSFTKEIVGVKGTIYRLNLSGSTAASLNSFVESNFA